MLCAIICGGLASMLLAATAMAAGDPAVGAGGGSGLAPAFEKVKGATVYEYCDSVAGCYPTEQLELAVFGKTKTWEFTHDPGVGGYVVKPKKQKYTYLVYNDGYCDGCFLVALKTKTGFFEGAFYNASDEFTGETWEAYKL